MLINVFTEARQRVRHSAHTFTLHFSKMYSNIIFPAKARSPKRQCNMRFQDLTAILRNSLSRVFTQCRLVNSGVALECTEPSGKIYDCQRLVSIQSTQTVQASNTQLRGLLEAPL
jgi:hypothetical protein